MRDTFWFVVAALASSAALAFVVKVTMLFLAGALVARAQRHRSAATRHFIWMLTLAGGLGLVLAEPLAPSLSVLIQHQPPISVAASPDLQPTHPAPATHATASLGETIRSQTAVSIAATSRSPKISPVAIWLAGTVAVVLWTLLGHVGLMLLGRSATSLDDPDWQRLVRASVAASGVRRRVRFAVSVNAGTPLTWGWLSPVILFPAEAREWPGDRRRAALLHELAHVARFDYVTQALAQIACALFWFHPMAWMSARRLRIESEQACDDRVLSQGTAPTEYATHLLDVARAARSLRLAGLVAVGMARPSHLEGRLLAVLDERRARRAISPRAGVVAGIALAALLILLGGVRLELRASAAPVDTPAAVVVAAPAADAPAPPLVSELDSVISRELSASPGELLDLDLETGATVHVRGWDQNTVSVRGMLGGPDWERTRVDIEGARGGVRVGMRQQGGSRASYSTSHSLDIRVPRRYDLRMRSAGGSITLVDVEGSFDGNTGGGEIRLNHIRGWVSLSTGGGDISVVDVNASGSVSTGGGLVRMSRVGGGLKGSSGSGPVIYTEAPIDASTRLLIDSMQRTSQRASIVTQRAGAPNAGYRPIIIVDGVIQKGDFDIKDIERERIDRIEAIKGAAARRYGAGATAGVIDITTKKQKGDLSAFDVDKSGRIRYLGGKTGVVNIEKAGGSVDLDEAPEGAKIRTGGGRIFVGRGAGTIEANTGGGDIEIGPIAGSVFTGTGAGDVTVQLVHAKGQAQSVEVFTGKGRVIVQLPPNYQGRFDLETAYTENFGRTTKIESAWTLEREQTTSWDDSQGTPRKYVRARGRLGSGDGVIYVRAVNGDVEVRRAP